MNLEKVILGFLNKESMRGDDLSKIIDTSVGFFWNATHSPIYTCFKKLDSERLATFNRVPQESGPERKIYCITEKGKNFFLFSLSKSIRTHEIKFPLLVVLFLGPDLGIEYWKKILNSRLSEQTSKLQLYEIIIKDIPDKSAKEDLDIFLKRRTVAFGIGYQEHFIHWIIETVKGFSL